MAKNPITQDEALMRITIALERIADALDGKSRGRQ